MSVFLYALRGDTRPGYISGGGGAGGGDVVMVGTWMGFGWTIMAGTWMLWQNGWGLGGRYHGWGMGRHHVWDMDALAERGWLGRGCIGRTDGVWVHVIMVDGCCARTEGVWVDARMGSGWTLSWVGHGCSGRTDGVWVDVIMVGTWMLWQNGSGLGRRYHGWDMDALAERTGSGWTLSWLGHGCSGRTDGV